jgi:glycosyltransferase involved in cell wall biosynthesis
VIASRVGGNPEVVSPDVGVLIPPRDPQALASALTAVLGDPTAVARMGSAGRELVRRDFSVQRMVAETAALYDVLEPSRAVAPAVAYRTTTQGL